ncbi:MAG: DUF4832 domain-containing protein [Candidatus Brocadiaceae bacterium]|jgi:hypothetical protein
MHGSRRSVAPVVARAVIGAALIAVVAAFVAAEALGGRTIRREFQESDRFLRNPDCGWVAYNYQDGYALRKRVAGGKEPFALASVVYTRHPSKSWVGPDGTFADSRPVRLLENWIAHRRHVAFRVYANALAHLPPELRDKVGRVSYVHEGKPAERILYWDRAYIEEHRRLIEFLGERFADSPYLAFVDVGGVGNTGGEWYLTPRGPFRKAGLDDDRAFELITTFVRMYRDAFPHTQLFIGYDCIKLAGGRNMDVVDLLERYGVGLRDDGLGGWPYPETPDYSDWPMQGLWRTLPVLFEGGGRGGGVYGWKLQEKEPAAVLEWALRRAHPTYINIGGAETTSQKACDELGELLRRYGPRLGYRFALLSAAAPAEVGPADTLELEMKWANRGVAPCYSDRQIELTLYDEAGLFAVGLAVSPDPPTTRWRPGTEVRVKARFSVPPTLPAGEYLLKVGMLMADPAAPTRHVQIATAGGDEEERYTIGRIRIVP